MLNAIFSKIHLAMSQQAVDLKSSKCDQIFNNHQNFCTHVELYLILRYVIKYANIDLLRYAIRHIVVLFQIKNAKLLKYANALLYLIHLTDSSATTQRLQDCVLANSLINAQDITNTSFELDRLIELLNNSLKMFQKKRFYFSKHNDQHLEYWTLNESYLQKLKIVVKFNFEKSRSRRHSVKSSIENI